MVKKKREGKAVHAVIKKLRGTYREDRDGGKLIIADLVEAIPAPPDYYSDNTKDMWFKICTTLMGAGLLQSIGIGQIEIYCDQFQLYKDALGHVKDKGSVIKITSKNGSTVVKRNPYIEIMGGAFVIMNQIADRFGFSPLSQSRIKNIGLNAENGKEKNEFDGI